MSNQSLSHRREALLDDGENHFYEGRFEDALTCFESAVALDGKDPNAHYLAARTLYYLGRDDESLHAFDLALEQDADFVAAIVHKAELMLKAFGWPEETLELLDRAKEIGLDGDDQVDAQFVRALALMEHGDFREALRELDPALESDPDWVDARRERGICYFYTWRFKEASKDLEASLRMDSTDAEAHYFLAMSLERLGKASDAEQHYRLASDLDPHAFPMPLRITRDQFELAAAQALDELPDEFKLRFNNVGIAVEDFPARNPNILPDLPGLFPASPSTRHPSAVYLEPASVVLFQKNLERYASDVETLKDEIGRTVIHEVGHFFGLGEDDAVTLNVH